MRFVILAGQPKTGTTSAQGLLAHNYDRLAAKGWLYPRSGRTEIFENSSIHFPLLHAINTKLGAPPKGQRFQRLPSLDQIVRNILDEIDRHRPHTVVISCEDFWRMGRRGWLTLAEAFPDFDRQTVVFLRRQDEWAMSYYFQVVRTGHFLGEIQEFLPRLAPDLDYHAKLAMMQEACPASSVTVVPYRSASDFSSDRALVEAIALDVDLDWNVDTSRNASLNRDAIEFMRLVSRTGVQMNFQQRNRMDRILAEFSTSHPEDPAFRYPLSPVERTALLAQHRDGNRKIAETYLDETARKHFAGDAMVDADGWRSYPGLARDAVERISGHLFDRLTTSRQRTPRDVP